MSDQRKASCEWCGCEFALTTNRGPVPRYCKPSHRQRAWEARHGDSLYGEVMGKWGPEIEVAAKRRRISPQSFIMKSVRRVLDGEPKERK